MSQSVELEQVKHVVLYRDDGSRFEMTEILGMPVEWKMSYPLWENCEKIVGKRELKGTLHFRDTFEKEVKRMEIAGFKTLLQAKLLQDEEQGQ